MNKKPLPGTIQVRLVELFSEHVASRKFGKDLDLQATAWETSQ